MSADRWRHAGTRSAARERLPPRPRAPPADQTGLLSEIVVSKRDRVSVVAQSTERYDKAVHAAWRRYGSAVRRLTPGAPSREFQQDGYLVGTLSHDVVDRVRRAVEAAPTITLRPEDWSPGYRFSEKARKVEAYLNSGHRYYASTPQLERALADVGRELATPVQAAIGSPWRVVHTRVLETLPAAETRGPNAWHGDGFPIEIIKVMIYFSPASRATGTTELRLDDERTFVVEGRPGTWLLFKNSEIVHRGLPPVAGPRLAVELTLVPAFRGRQEPCFAGLNSTYPEHPGWRLRPARWAWRTLVANRLRGQDGTQPGSRRARHQKTRTKKKQKQR